MVAVCLSSDLNSFVLVLLSGVRQRERLPVGFMEQGERFGVVPVLGRSVEGRSVDSL